jgi:hypothetical protein
MDVRRSVVCRALVQSSLVLALGALALFAGCGQAPNHTDVDGGVDGGADGGLDGGADGGVDGGGDGGADGGVACDPARPAPQCDDHNPCTTDACASSGFCTNTPVADGPAPAANQTAGNCQQAVCTAGALTSITDDRNLPAAVNDCGDPTCTGGKPGQSYASHPLDSVCSSFTGSMPGFCDGTGHCVQCTKDNECSGTNDDCRAQKCTNHACTTVFTAANTPTINNPPQPAPPNCQQIVCDGTGGHHSIVDDTRVPSSGTVCITDGCSNGTVTQTPNPGVSCSASGKLCTATGACGCQGNQDCTSPQTCGGGGTAGVCGCTPAATCGTTTCGTITNGCTGTLACNDSIKDGNETDIDCGGNPSTCATRCAQGKKCTAPSDCASGLSCADGVCCNTPCTGSCQACSAVAKGQGADGVCGAVKSGVTDPKNACTATAQSTCGPKGTLCNGAGACQLWLNGTVCQAASCTSATLLAKAQTCNGSGSCVAGSPATSDCTPYLCSNATCATSCGTFDSNCVPGDFCNGASQCQALKQAGTACGGNHECAGNLCAGGFCCSGACLDHGSASCGTRGTCASGTGACQLYAAGTTCSSPVSCSNQMLTVATQCDGAGLCSQGQSTSACAGNTTCATLVCAGAGGCGTVAFSDGYCASGFFCDGVGAGTCQAKLLPGTVCTNKDQCVSNNCAAGTCA